MTPNRDGATGISPIVALDPAVLSADATSVAIDLLGFQAATLILLIGAGGIVFTAANRIDVVLSHSEDDVTYAPVTADDLVLDGLEPAEITGGIVRSLRAVHAAATVQKIGYVGAKRYLKVQADFSGVHGTGTPIAAAFIRALAELTGAA